MQKSGAYLHQAGAPGKSFESVLGSVRMAVRDYRKPALGALAYPFDLLEAAELESVHTVHHTVVAQPFELGRGNPLRHFDYYRFVVLLSEPDFQNVVDDAGINRRRAHIDDKEVEEVITQGE